MTSPTVSQSGNSLQISVPSGSTDSGSASPASSADAGAASGAPTSSTATANTSTADATANNAAATNSNDPNAAASSSPDAPKTKLESFVDNRDQQKFTGSPITLQVRDADLADVFRLIAEASGFNILLGDSVKGKITLSMINVPWDQALDVILRTQKLGAERNNNLLRIVSLTDLTNEKQEELAAQEASEASAPRVTKVVPINYANLTDLVATLTKFAQANAAAATTTGTSRINTAQLNIVQADSRTNSIILRDTPDNVEKMLKLIAILDTQTPQVLIEAKIVETTEQFGKQISGGLGIQGNGYAFGFNGGNPLTSLFSNPTTSSTGAATAGTTSQTLQFLTGNGSFGIQPSVGFIPGLGQLNAILSLGESEQESKLIASPRTVVLNKEATTITQSTPVLINQLQTTQTGQITLQTVQQANLSLNVTPTITNEGSVLLQLAISRDLPLTIDTKGDEGVANRNITTKVLVESGSTLVIGGIYTSDKQHNESGVPWLRKLPIIGPLFGSTVDSDTRNELFFFITPRILNPKEAGLGT
jgi:type IV pilus assembly protein PilQ